MPHWGREFGGSHHFHCVFGDLVAGDGRNGDLADAGQSA
jgi:hypothetical protein